MKPEQEIGRYGLFLCSTALIILLVMGMNTHAAGGDEKTSSTVIWDTTSPFGDSVDLQNRTSWKIVPTNPFMLERDPAAAASDPGR